MMNPMIGCNPSHGSLTRLHKDRWNGWCKKSSIRIRIGVGQFSLFGQRKDEQVKGSSTWTLDRHLWRNQRIRLWSILSKVLKTKELVKEHNLNQGFCASSLKKKTHTPKFITTTLKNCTNKLVRISRWLWVLKSFVLLARSFNAQRERVYECTYLRDWHFVTQIFNLVKKLLAHQTQPMFGGSPIYLSILIMSGKGIHDGFVTIFFFAISALARR